MFCFLSAKKNECSCLDSRFRTFFLTEEEEEEEFYSWSKRKRDEIPVTIVSRDNIDPRRGIKYLTGTF